MRSNRCGTFVGQAVFLFRHKRVPIRAVVLVSGSRPPVSPSPDGSGILVKEELEAEERELFEVVEEGVLCGCNSGDDDAIEGLFMEEL